MLTKKQLKQLRNEIVLNSLFLKDYSNTLYISEKTACSFFDSYIENLYDIASDDGFNSKDIIDIIDKYDNIDNLYNYYMDCCIDGYDPLLKDDYIAYIFIGIGYSILIYDVSDYKIKVAAMIDNKISKITSNSVFYDNNGDPYFKKYGYKYYLSEAIRKDR